MLRAALVLTFLTSNKETQMRMYDPPHPGPILAACFGGGRSIESTAARIGIPVTDITAVLEGKAPITPKLAEQLHTVITKIPGLYRWVTCKQLPRFK